MKQKIRVCVLVIMVSMVAVGSVRGAAEAPPPSYEEAVKEEVAVEQKALVVSATPAGKKCEACESANPVQAKFCCECGERFVEGVLTPEQIDAIGAEIRDVAARGKNKELRKLLNQYPGLVDAADESRLTPLWHAVMYNGDSDTVSILIDSDATIDARDDDTMMTPLIHAAHHGKLAIVKQLVRGKAYINTTALGGMTALHVAAEKGHSAVVSFLLKGKAFIDQRTNKKQTALYLASLHGQTDVMKILVVARASVDIATEQGFTPLMEAAEKGNDEGVRLLLGAGARTDLASVKSRYTALMYAIGKEKINVVSLLLANGRRDIQEQTEERDVGGRTPLMLAARVGNRAVVALLLQAKASLLDQDNEGVQAWQYAAREGYSAIEQELVEAASAEYAIVQQQKARERRAAWVDKHDGGRGFAAWAKGDIFASILRK